ncbi:MAG: thioredoxin domain-containing protein [Nitrospirae bacterium]|nr:MAG: thioredoxin domain-containing protein [Nitrospirota bacterium]
MNRLGSERSPYLRHAADQPIDWYPWSDEAFQRAADEDKPVFLSSGAVWCHWCHVMAKECFYNEEIAGMLNRDFICIKLDRDERPDIDRRYQQAVVAIAAAGGWPLSVFLMPDKRPFFGGTYFPPDDSHGRPGFKKVLAALLDFFKTKRAEADEYTQRLLEHLRQEGPAAGELSPAMADRAAESILAAFDSANGGFGQFPKFPMPGAIEFLTSRYSRTHDESSANVIRRTLSAMARGGFHDQLQGGFHRYSVDEAWFVPHFEKMADDNAWLLRNYVSAYSLFGDAYYKEVAEGIVRFSREVLSAPEGGFYASQDADVTPDDEGGYFTWTDEDLRRVLDEDEYRVLFLHYFSPRGRMHHDDKKHVLCIAKEPEEIAEMTGLEASRVQELISSARKKLLAERSGRVAPYLDTTIYTSLNGLFITAYMKAYKALGDDSIREFGLASLDRILKEHVADGRLYHCSNIPALLDDYVFLIEALLAAYEATADRKHLSRAEEFMETCIEKFWDSSSGGFFDAEEKLLDITLKQVEDIPHPSANAVAVVCLLELQRALGNDRYLRHAEDSLKAFAARVPEMGLHAGYYFRALDLYFQLNG